MRRKSSCCYFPSIMVTLITRTWESLQYKPILQFWLPNLFPVLFLLVPFSPLSILTPFQFSLVQSLSRVWLFLTPWTKACQASLSITDSQSPPKPMSIESVMPSNHLIICRPLLLPSIFPSIRVFSNDSVLHIRWPKYWEFQLQHQSFQWTPRTDLL